MYSGNDLKKGVLIELDGAPYRVVEFAHHAMGRGGGVVNVKIKNLITGNLLSKTFRPTDKFQPAEVERRPMQFLYREGESCNFMDPNSYEQESLDAETVGDAVNYLSEGSEATFLMFNNRIIGLELPNAVTLKVTHTEPGARGDTATAAQKPATLETGFGLNVPLFINEGDQIKVDTRTGAYLERQK